MTARRPSQCLRILAIDPSPKGFGFAVLESDSQLVDWGVAVLSSKADLEFLARLEGLVDRTRPALLVLEDPTGTRLGLRHVRLIRGATEYARTRRLRVEAVSRATMRNSFGTTCKNKYDIAVAISRQFPELASRLPAKRRLWTSEDERMNIFDAVALALTALSDYYSH